MRHNGERPDLENRRSLLLWGCAIAAAVALITFEWIVSEFVFWKESRIPLPDRSGSVTYVARLRKVFCAEWERKIRLDTDRFHGEIRWIPGDPGGAWPVNVY